MQGKPEIKASFSGPLPGNLSEIYLEIHAQNIITCTILDESLTTVMIN